MAYIFIDSESELIKGQQIKEPNKEHLLITCAN